MNGLDPNGWTVRTRDGSTPPDLVVIRASLLGEASALSSALVADAAVIWSGSLADEPFARDWATWGPRGWEALMAACATAGPSLTERGVRVLLRPHARHVLSDPYKCLRFIAERPALCFGLALDAAAMLEHSMLADAGGHFERAFEMLGPVAAAVVLTGVARADDEQEPPVITAPDEGLVNPRLIGELVRRHINAATPLLLPGVGAPEADRQLAALDPPPLH